MLVMKEKFGKLVVPDGITTTTILCQSRQGGCDFASSQICSVSVVGVELQFR